MLYAVAKSSSYRITIFMNQNKATMASKNLKISNRILKNSCTHSTKKASQGIKVIEILLD